MTVFEIFTRIVETTPKKIAFIQSDQAVTYEEVWAMAKTEAQYLQSIGLRPHNRCLISLGNSIETASVLLGVFSTNAIPVLINEEAPESHLSHAADKTDCSISIQGCNTRKPLTSTGNTFSTATTLINTHKKEPSVNPGNTLPADGNSQHTASILFTSGSTGMPKGVAQSHSSLIQACKSVASSLGLKKTDSILCSIPWSFDYGFGQYLSTILLGITQILPKKNDPFSISECIEQHRPTVFPGVPSLFATLLRGVSPIRDTDCSSIRLVTSTGSKIHHSLREDLFQLLNTSSFSFNYGLTETYRTASLPQELARTDSDSVTVDYTGVILHIISEEGSEAATDEEGEIVHSGIGTFQCYRGDAYATQKTRRYLQDKKQNTNRKSLQNRPAVFTGDIGRIDERGMLYLSGRHDRQLKSMGIKVNPEEIELLMRNFPMIEDIAIVSRYNEIIGDELIAVVVSRPGADDPIGEIKKHCKNLFGQYMRPRRYIMTQKLPRTTSGKIDYTEVQNLIQ